MVQMAREIFSKHLCIGAHEPVNVDSHARQVAQEGLDSPTPELFLPAQKQVCDFSNLALFVLFLYNCIPKPCSNFISVFSQKN